MGLFSESAAPQGPLSASSLFSVKPSHSPFDIEKLADRYRHRNLGWTIPEAYLALLFLAADADGQFKDEERAQIQLVARRAPALRALMERNELGMHEASALQKIQQDKHAALEEACLTLPAEMCLSVFAHCVDLMLADGELVKAEAEWIEELYPRLDISEEYAKRILAVLLLKAQY